MILVLEHVSEMSTKFGKALDWIIKRGLAALLVLATLGGVFLADEVGKLVKAVDDLTAEVAAARQRLVAEVAELTDSLSALMADVDTVLAARTDHEDH